LEFDERGGQSVVTDELEEMLTELVLVAVWGRSDEMRADVVEVRRWQLEIPAVCEELERLQRRYMGAPLVVEAVGGFKAVPQTLRRINPRLKVVECKPSADKFVRAQPVAAAWKAGRVRTPVAAAWLPDFVHELGAFTGVKDAHDDQVDALAHAWSYAEQMPVAVKSRAVSSGERRAMDGW
jgi:predicted phage terminase large subunit-like protein